MSEPARSSELDDILLSVWRQSLLERKRNVTIQGETYPVRPTPKHGLAQVDFEFGGHPLRGLEQNPQTASRWAQLARKGSKVMQFLSAGRYIAAVCDAQVTHYGSASKQDRD
jgi:hypothetical protein